MLKYMYYLIITMLLTQMKNLLPKYFKSIYIKKKNKDVCITDHSRNNFIYFFKDMNKFLEQFKK